MKTQTIVNKTKLLLSVSFVVSLYNIYEYEQGTCMEDNSQNEKYWLRHIFCRQHLPKRNHTVVVAEFGRWKSIKQNYQYPGTYICTVGTYYRDILSLAYLDGYVYEMHAWLFYIVKIYVYLLYIAQWHELKILGEPYLHTVQYIANPNSLTESRTTLVPYRKHSKQWRKNTQNGRKRWVNSASNNF